MTSSNLSIESGQDLGYGQIFAIIWRRRFWFLGAFIAVLPITLFLALKEDPQYQSSLQLLVEPNYQSKPGSEGDPFADSTVQVDYATQLNLLRSTTLLQRAVDRLKDRYPNISVGEIKGSLTLSQLQENEVETKIFQAGYVSDDPVKTQAVLEEMQKVYIEYNQEQQRLRLRNGLLFIDEQLPEVTSDVSQAEGELKQFRESQNILDPDRQGNALTDAIQSIRSERQTLQAQLEEKTAQFKELRSQVKQSVQDAVISARLSQSSRYQSLLQEIQSVDVAIAQRRVTYTENDPGLIALLDQKQELIDLLKTESQRVGQQVNRNIESEVLLTQGQLSDIDTNLIQEYVATRVELLGIAARDSSLEQTEQQLLSEFREYPNLIAEYNRLQPEVDVKRQSLEELLKARQDLSIELARGGFNWQVIESPQLGYQINQNTTRNFMLGAITALFLGGIAAFIREGLDDTLHTSAQLEQGAELPLLGSVPKLSSAEILPSQLAYSQTFRESVDLIYKNIQMLSPAVSIVVTSALPGEGKTTLALGLALSAARSQQRVLLIDGDLRQPTLHKHLDIPNDRGLSNWLNNDFRTVKRHRVWVSNTYINVVTAGPVPDDPVKLLSSGKLQKILSRLEQTYDQIIIDAPALNGVVDAIQISSCCQGVVMVGRLNHVSQTDLSRATQTLNRFHTIGVVANGSREITKLPSFYTKQLPGKISQPDDPLKGESSKPALS